MLAAQVHDLINTIVSIVINSAVVCYHYHKSKVVGITTGFMGILWSYITY